MHCAANPGQLCPSGFSHEPNARVPLWWGIGADDALWLPFMAIGFARAFLRVRAGLQNEGKHVTGQFPNTDLGSGPVPNLGR